MNNRTMTSEDVSRAWGHGLIINRETLTSMTDEALDTTIDMIRQWAGGLWDRDPEWTEAHNDLSLALTVRSERNHNQ